MTLAPLTHQLEYIDGTTRCTACGKFGFECVPGVDPDCAGRRPSATTPADMTDAEAERIWNITRSLACE